MVSVWTSKVAARRTINLAFFFSSRRLHTRLQGDWSSYVCSSDLATDVSVLRSLAALGAFASGGVVGGMVTSGRPRTPARHLLIAMYAEILLLSVAVTAALVTGN